MNRSKSSNFMIFDIQAKLIFFLIMYPYKIYNSINHFGNCALPSSESISRSGFKFLAKHSAIIKAIFEEIIVIQNTESCHKIWYFAKILHFSKVAQASETT